MSRKPIPAAPTWRDFLAVLRKPVRKVRYDARFGVLAIMKNEAMNVDEWIEHYLWMGAGRIFLIDNCSTDDTLAKARAWVTRGRVEPVIYPERHQQV